MAWTCSSSEPRSSSEELLQAALPVCQFTMQTRSRSSVQEVFLHG